MARFGKIWKTIGTAGAGVAALAAVNAHIRRNVQEPDEVAFGGDARSFEWSHGNISYHVGGIDNPGPPLVLVHGVGAGSSSFMWRRNFDQLARDFRVYALDLLGFGFSDKPAGAPYSADLYVELVADFLREASGAPAHVVAHSLGAAYVVRLAADQPELIDSLVLIAPTGAGATLRTRPGMAGAAFYGLLQSPVLGTSFYNVMASERSIREFARRELFYDRRRATDRLVAQYYATSHQPGAQHAIAAFLSGYLNADTRDSFAQLTQPVSLVWGKQDRTNPIEHAAEFLNLNPRAGLEIFDQCRMMPQEEYPSRFNELILNSFRKSSHAAA